MKTTVSKDGTRLAYDVSGKGPNLIYITGATTFRNFKPVLYDVSVFASEFTVYSYDRRGRGDSGDTLPYAPEREIEDIETMIDASGGRAHLYGHSSGAILALEAAMRLGEKVDKIVLYDPAYAHNATYQKEFIALGKQLNGLLEQGKNDEAISGFFLGVGLPEEALNHFQQSPDWPTMVALAPTLAYDTRLASDLPPLERAKKLRTPTQIIVGEKSPDTIHQVGKQLKSVMPNAGYTELKDQDHMPSAETVLEELVWFLK